MAKRTYGDGPGGSAGTRHGSGNMLLLVIVLGMLAALILCMLLFVVFYNNHEYGEIRRVVDQVGAVANSAPGGQAGDGAEASSEPEPTPGMQMESLYSRDPLDRELNWEGILDINRDVKFWLYVPETVIDYAVLHEQYPLDGSEYFYLRHDIYGAKSMSGWPFVIDAPSDDEIEDMHTIVFGHNMGSGRDTMFGTLDRYKKKDFFESSPYIYVYYPDHSERWAIWSAYNVSSDDLLYSMPYESGSVDYASLLSTIGSSGMYDTGVTSVRSDRKVLTLSTCDRSYGGQTGRFVVNAVLDRVRYPDGTVATADEYYANQ